MARTARRIRTLPVATSRFVATIRTPQPLLALRRRYPGVLAPLAGEQGNTVEGALRVLRKNFSQAELGEIWEDLGKG